MHIDRQASCIPPGSFFSENGQANVANHFSFQAYRKRLQEVCFIFNDFHDGSYHYRKSNTPLSFSYPPPIPPFFYGHHLPDIIKFFDG